MVVRRPLEYEAVNWNASEFWVDGGCRGNQAHRKREAYGSISDGESIERVQFVNAHTNNEAESRLSKLGFGILTQKKAEHLIA